ncbi:AAA family ATPase [Micromonospora sp. NPDC049801]|uniref:ATP-binding protein n=1 Tax=unclassified Micromonospora TaxID=2617518 RepID=UPI00340E08C4
MKVEECVVTDEIVRDDERHEILWDAIIVPDTVKDQIRNQALLALMVRPAVPFVTTALHGMVTLYGPPGTGKTTLARGLPQQLAMYVRDRAVRLIEVNPHGLMSAEHGQSQQRVDELLGDYLPSLAADGMPTVVVLDEVESMAVARSAASLAANPADVHRATDAVLTALDRNAQRHPHLFVVATSNFTDALDEAFLSRSDAAILVPLPNQPALLAILRSTLIRLGEQYPKLRNLADDARLGTVADRALGLDGRRTRKTVFQALARRLDTVLDPERLTLDDLADTISLVVAEDPTEHKGAHDAAA